MIRKHMCICKQWPPRSREAHEAVATQEPGSDAVQQLRQARRSGSVGTPGGRPKVFDSSGGQDSGHPTTLTHE